MFVIVNRDGTVQIKGSATPEDAAIIEKLKKWLRDNPAIKVSEGEVENHKLIVEALHTQLHAGNQPH